MRIFVFGSNLRGVHGAGAAQHAHDHYGARYGRGEGLSGHSYAVPTKDWDIKTLPLIEIRHFVSRLLDVAGSRPELTFHITRVGCGLAGYTDEQIGPMFKDFPENCEFSPEWAQKFGYKQWPSEM